MRRIVFRLLLCLMLVLNGTGYAVAATQMHVTHMAMALAAHEAESVPPCHEAAAQEMASESVRSHGHDMAGTADSKTPPCCQSSQCSCDYCLQHATAAVAVEANVGDALPGGTIAQPRVAHRIAPPLPDPLRPPIG